jgi:hypothetical protein
MQIQRHTLAADVLKVRRPARISIASPRDFVLGRARTVSGAAGSLPLPYCLDIPRRRSLYVSSTDPAAAVTAPFYYLHLRRTAREVVSVPWESGPLEKNASTTEPVLVFSPGRVGSTLLCGALSAAGIASVSEPDFFTQATMQFWSSAINPLRQRIGRALGDLSHDLCAALGRDGLLVVKLRSECCRAPELLVSGARRRTIFIVRDFESWARSTIRVFRADPGRAVARYLRALRGYAWLKENTACHVLHYEALVSDSEGAAAALSGFLQRNVSPETFGSAMHAHSQSGTPLDPSQRPQQDNFEQTFSRTLALWESPRIRALRRDLPFYGLAG